jgi:hypothetical protein
MTASDLASFNHELLTIGLKQFKTQQQVADVERDKGDAVKISTKDPKAIEGWYENKLNDFKSINGREPSLAEEIKLASEIRRPVKSLNDKVKNSILNGDVNNGMDAMIALANAKGRDLEALSGVGKEANAKALKFNKFLQAGNNAGDAWLKTNENFGDLSPQEKDGLDAKWNDDTKNDGNFDISTSEKKQEKAAEALDFPTGEMPAGLPLIWEQELKTNFHAARGDWDIANKMTKDTFDKAWGVEDGKVKYLPASKFIPNYPLAEPFIKNQLIEGFKGMAAEYKELYDNDKLQDFYYELDVKEVEPEGKFEYAYKGGSFGITRGGDIHVKKIYRDGTVQKGILEYEADNRSLLPEQGMVPNYYVGMNINGVTLPFKSPKNQYQPLRYQPDFSEELQEEFSKNKRHLLDMLIQKESDYPLKKAIRKIDKEMENPYGY